MDTLHITDVLAAGLRASGVSAEEADYQARLLYLKALIAYEEAGQPYGPEHNGLMRWVLSQPLKHRQGRREGQRVYTEAR